MSLTHNTIFDIVGFIEKNPLSRLNSTYQDNLINKIKNNFNDEEQQIFVTSFYTYLNYNPLTDFVIDFDNVWRWCGFSRKDHAKRILEKHFVLDVDYKVSLPHLGEQKNEGENRGGFNKEKITFNIRTFKKFCLKCETDKADEIHNYYIKLEEILHETLLEQTDELQLQLEEKQETIDALSKKYIKKPRQVFDYNNVVYIITSEEGEKIREYTIGKSIDLKNRLESYDNNKLHDFKVVYYKSCNSVKLMDLMESIILTKLGNYRCKAGRDVFLLPKTENIKLFTDIFDVCTKFYENVEENHIIFPRRTYKNDFAKEKISETGKKYYEENKDRIIEKSKEYYYENKEDIAVKNKKYQEEHKEEISVKGKEYREINKEKISQRRQNYYEDNKEEIIKKVHEYSERNREKICINNKLYREEHKEKISEQRKIYRGEHKEELSEKSKKYYEENKDRIIEKSKKYYSENKDEMMEKSKKYYEENKEKLSQKLSQKVTCECGSEFRKGGYSRHIKTGKHNEYIENKDKILEKK